MKLALGFTVAIAVPLVFVAACDGGGGSNGTTSGSSSGASSSGASSSGASSSGGSSSGGSSSGGSSSGASPGQEDAYCQAWASHETCKDAAVPRPCDEDGKCIWGRVASKAGADAFIACYAAPSCKSADQCSGEAGLTAGGAAAQTYFNECGAKLDACAGGFHDDLCNPGIFAFTGLGEAAQACLSKPCNEIEACLDAAIKPISDCK